MNRVIGPFHTPPRLLVGLQLLLLLSTQSVGAETPAGREAVPLPEVRGPIPVTATSRPFLGSKGEIDAAGYLDEEYFLSGKANVYEWVGQSRNVRTIAGPASYTTRVLVRRPRDASKFSGNVNLEILNASTGVDVAALLMTASDLMMRQGDVWIGLTSKPIVAKALQKFDAARYAALDWSNPAPAASRCANPSTIPTYLFGDVVSPNSPTRSLPETEDGLAWDMISQLGRLLKSEQRAKLLPGFRAPLVFLSGASQSGLYLRTWVTAFHALHRLPSGKPIYDGYYNVVMAAMARINQCAPDIGPRDPRNHIVPPDVPFISLMSEGEMWLGVHTRQPDTVTAKGGFVTYEVAGGSHGWGSIPGTSYGIGQAPPEDIAKAGVDNTAFARLMPRITFVPNDLAWVPVMRASLRNLQLWAREGVLPPQAPPLQLDASLKIQRDQNGNALGGLRMPYIDVPTASHLGSIGDNGGYKVVMGSRTPFSAEKLKALYATHGAYVTPFSAATDRLVAKRWVLADDAQAMKKAAEASKVPE